MDIELSAEDLSFREEVRAFFAENTYKPGSNYIEWRLEWFEKAAAKGGWDVPKWPTEFGGPGWSPTQHYIWEQETAVANLPMDAPFGPGMLAPVLMAYGSEEQQQLSASQGGLSSTVAFAIGAAGLLPVIWFLDDSAGLIHELSPVQGSSRLVTLMLCVPLLALIVWQLQQLVQAVILLSSEGSQPIKPLDSEQLHEERTSFGLQLLRLAPLEWTEPSTQSKSDAAATKDDGDDSLSISTAGGAVEPEQSGEENQSTSLDADIGEIDGNTSGSPEEHGEEPEPSGGEQREPEDPS